MKTMLVMGGTSFFGKRLVEALLQAGCKVTVATRGSHADPFGGRVERVTMDRQNRASMKAAVGGRSFDVVYDQIGYAPDDVADSCEVFAGKIGRYIYTSSVMVYPPGSGLKEGDFDPMTTDPGSGRSPAVGYVEGKRRAEAYLFQRASFPVAAARFPIVMGADDATGRMQAHVGCVVRGEAIVVRPPAKAWTYIWAEDAGRFAAWLGLNAKAGAYNAGSRYAIDAAEIVMRMGKVLGKEPVLRASGPGYESQYAFPYEAVMDMGKTEREGFRFGEFEEWFPEVVRATAAGK